MQEGIYLGKFGINMPLLSFIEENINSVTMSSDLEVCSKALLCMRIDSSRRRYFYAISKRQASYSFYTLLHSVYIVEDNSAYFYEIS